jgi:GT2 family glycosyltransferase
MSASKTAVVVVNWNGESYLEELIRSVDAEKPAQFIAIDNNSSDSSLQILQAHPGIALIANTENVGFGAAANQGIELSKAANVLILNADLQAMPGAIQSLEKFLDTHNDAGAVAPKLMFPDGNLQPSCRKFPTPSSLFFYLTFLDRIIPINYRLSAKQHDDTQTVDQPMGAALMIRKSILDQIGSFDESYFLYMEDVELCERIIRAGWKIYYYPVAEFIHDAGGSSRKDPYNSQKHFVESALLYFRKKHYEMGFTKLTIAAAYIIRSLGYFFTGNFKNASNCIRLSKHAFKFE